VTGERVAVHAVIVVLADAVVVEAQPEGVHVLDVKEIPRWFRARPYALDPRQTNRIYEATRKGGTWRDDVSALRGRHGGLTTHVWKRYGHDRVYVNDAAGADLGHLDRKTGLVHVRDVARGDDVRAALARHAESR
jgi:hypothetical protein